MGEEARQRPLLHIVSTGPPDPSLRSGQGQLGGEGPRAGAGARGVKDLSTTGREDDLSRSVYPSKNKQDDQDKQPNRARQRASRPLTPSEVRLVRWVESYVVTGTPPNPRGGARVHGPRPTTAFVGAERLLRRYGAGLVRRALSSMTEIVECPIDQTLVNDRWELLYADVRCWKGSVVSPAHLLNYLCQQIAGDVLKERDANRRAELDDEQQRLRALGEGRR